MLKLGEVVLAQIGGIAERERKARGTYTLLARLGRGFFARRRGRLLFFCGKAAGIVARTRSQQTV